MAAEELNRVEATPLRGHKDGRVNPAARASLRYGRGVLLGQHVDVLQRKAGQ